MGFQIIQKLSSKEKARKCEECLQFLQEEGQMPDLATIRKTLLEAYVLTQMLANDLHHQEEKALAASKLASHIEELVNTIKA